MPVKLLQVVLPEGAAIKIDKVTNTKPLAQWTTMSQEKQRIISLLLRAEQTQEVMDALHSKFSYIDGFSVIQLPLEAVLPRLEESNKQDDGERRTGSQLNREALYTSVNQGIKNLQLYLGLVFLSSLVACIGLINDDIAVVIGAMVIAPLLGPNVALALATTLADQSLMLRSAKLIAIGMLLAITVAITISVFIDIDFTVDAIQARTSLSGSSLVLALASGSAGILAITRGLPSALIGVMVAVALMPPLVTSGMLLGAGEFQLGIKALLLTIANIIGVNLAGVLTFWFQGVRPRSWWREDIARKHAMAAGLVWAFLLMALTILIFMNLV